MKNTKQSLCILDKMKTVLKSQEVIDLRRISIKMKDNLIQMKTYIFTFNVCQIQKRIQNRVHHQESETLYTFDFKMKKK